MREPSSHLLPLTGLRDEDKQLGCKELEYCRGEKSATTEMGHGISGVRCS